jgi:phosphoribosylamine--glycine ligase
MTVLLVGGGGREHALAWRLAQDDPRLSIIAAPGNPGIAELAECVPVAANDIAGLMKLARERRVEFTIVGPEAPLAAGIVDHFRAEKLPIFGPTRAAAEIETSKAFAKDLMREAGIPTARAIIATDADKAKKAAREFGAPVVIKASGLAAGKGVIVCQTIEEADAAIESMLVKRAFGVASQEILVEEFMLGEELSLLVITDGQRIVSLPAAQDHKRLLDGDRGPNTGGMGAYAPVSLASKAEMHEIFERIIRPTLDALASKKRGFRGLLYAGLMLTDDGPKVVEFNCRFGDPETQAILPIVRFSMPFTELLACVARGDRLPESVAVERHGHAVTTVIAAAGYPEQPRGGGFISMPSDLGTDVIVFHAGTARDADGHLIASGGRVLTVTGVGATLEAAHRRSQDAAHRIDFDGRQFRSDIGWRELERQSRHARTS